MNAGREFILTQIFDEVWKELGLTDNELRILENMILEDPEIGDLIRGTGGLRKVRIAFGGRGKRGSGRVVYVDFASLEKVYLIAVYPKNKIENLDDNDKREFRNFIKFLKEEAKDGEKIRKNERSGSDQDRSAAKH